MSMQKTNVFVGSVLVWIPSACKEECEFLILFPLRRHIVAVFFNNGIVFVLMVFVFATEVFDVDRLMQENERLKVTGFG